MIFDILFVYICLQWDAYCTRNELVQFQFPDTVLLLLIKQPETPAIIRDGIRSAQPNQSIDSEHNTEQCVRLVISKELELNSLNNKLL